MQPAPPNGSPSPAPTSNPGAPKPQAPAAAPAAAAPPEPAQAAAPATPPSDARLEELARQTKQQALHAQKLAQQRRELDTRASELEKRERQQKEWEALRQDRARNPGKYLAQDYGEDWYDKLTEYRASGGTPTAALVASEVEDRFGRLQKQLDEREAALKAKLTDFETREAQKQQADFENGVLGYISANAEKYPLVAELKAGPQVLAAMRAHFEATMKRGPDGELLPGELLTADEAAAKVEAEIRSLGERIAKKLQPAPTPPAAPAAPQRSEPAQRQRSLSTTMTASSTPAPRTPVKDDRERMQRAMAAWEAARTNR